MRKIPQILLQARRESLSNQLDHTISRKLDESMTELYTQALLRVDQRLRQKKISKDVSNQPSLMESLKQRLLIEELRVSLSQIFSRSNLLDPAKYAALEQSIQHWCPWSMEVQQSGPLVKQLLIEMLPDARKQQQLKSICADYKAHLTAKIEGELKSEHPKVYKAYQAQPPQVFGGPTLKGGLQTQASFDPCRPLERFLTETAPQLKNPSTSLKSAMDNFQAVRRLETTLENPIKPVTKQVQDFSHQFKIERVVIEKNPDSYAVQFIKSALDYLSRGWIQKLGFWRVRGQEASQQIEKTLKPPMIPATSTRTLGG